MKTALIAATLLFSLSILAHSAAAPYPSQPIKLIVGFSPGGPTDVVSRLMARKLSEGLGQPVIVENRPGAGGTIGAELAARAPADGYTLFLGTTGTLASAPSLYPTLGYDPVRSFAPISRIVNTPFLVVVHSSVAATSLRELIDLAKARPRQLHYGSAGNGNPTHIAGEMFQIAAGVELVHVPYKGMPPVLIDLLPGRLQLVFSPPSTLLPHLRSGKLRALAVAGPKRLPQLPQIPTAVEAGLLGYQVTAWFGLVAPTGTPDAVVRRLNDEVRRALSTQDAQDSLLSEGFEPSGSSPEELGALIRSDVERWARAVKVSGAKLE